MAFLEQGFKTGQFLRLDGSHFDARSGLHHTTRRCSLFRWRFHPSPSHRKTRKLSRTKSNPSTSASYKTRRRNPGDRPESLIIGLAPGRVLVQIPIFGPIWQASDAISPRATVSAHRPFLKFAPE